MGNIKNVKSNVILKVFDNGKGKRWGGYRVLQLCKNGQHKNHRVHRLVMLAFAGESDLGVNHKNGIKSDNRLENLEYATHKENVRHAFDTGLAVGTSLPGSKHPRSKLIESDVVEIKKMLSNDIPQYIIAEMFNVTNYCICDINTNKTWKHVNV